MNTVHIPARARNKEDATRFLAFVMRADVQEALNRAMLQLPVNTQAAVADDRFLRPGPRAAQRRRRAGAILRSRHERGPRDVAMKGFQEFMLQPERLDAILATIERRATRIYGPLPRAAAVRSDGSRRLSVARVPRRRGSGERVTSGLATVILLAPACVLFALFVIYPILASIRLSLHDWDGVGAIDLRRARQLSRARSPTRCSATALANNLRWLALLSGRRRCRAWRSRSCCSGRPSACGSYARSSSCRS